MYHLVDHQAFGDECTSSADTTQRHNFRKDICRRDNNCVITGRQRDFCDAVHIIPHSKGSKISSSVPSRPWVMLTFSLVYYLCCS